MSEPGKQYANNYEQCAQCGCLRPHRDIIEVVTVVDRAGDATTSAELQCRDQAWCENNRPVVIQCGLPGYSWTLVTP